MQHATVEKAVEPSLSGSAPLDNLGCPPGSIVEVALMDKGFIGADKLDGRLAQVLGADERTFSLSFIGEADPDGQCRFETRLLPRAAIVLRLRVGTGEHGHLRAWFSFGDGDGERAHGLKHLFRREYVSLVRQYLTGLTTDEVFRLLEASCDIGGFGLADSGRWSWSDSIEWRAMTEKARHAFSNPQFGRHFFGGDLLSGRILLVDELLARPGEPALDFIRRTNGSLEDSFEMRRRPYGGSDAERGPYSSMLRDTHRDGRTALIGMAWHVLRGASLDTSSAEVRTAALRLLALALRHETAMGAPPTFWAGVPPLPGMEEEHGRTVFEAVTVYLERSDVEWRALRAFLYEGGIDRAMRPLEKLGLSPNVFAQAMLKRWGADPDIAVFAKGSPTSFASHDQTAAIEVLIDGMRTYEAHVVARVVGGRSALWQRLDDGQKARLVESVRLHLVADRQFAERLWMVRDQLPHPFEGDIVKAYNGY